MRPNMLMVTFARVHARARARARSERLSSCVCWRPCRRSRPTTTPRPPSTTTIVHPHETGKTFVATRGGRVQCGAARRVATISCLFVCVGVFAAYWLQSPSHLHRSPLPTSGGGPTITSTTQVRAVAVTHNYIFAVGQNSEFTSITVSGMFDI